MTTRELVTPRTLGPATKSRPAGLPRLLGSHHRTPCRLPTGVLQSLRLAGGQPSGSPHPLFTGAVNVGVTLSGNNPLSLPKAVHDRLMGRVTHFSGFETPVVEQERGRDPGTRSKAVRSGSGPFLSEHRTQTVPSARRREVSGVSGGDNVSSEAWAGVARAPA